MDIISDVRGSNCIQCLPQNPDCSIRGVSYKWENRLVGKTRISNLEKSREKGELEELQVDNDGFCL